MKYIISFFLLLIPLKALPCDACGCVSAGAGGGYSSIFDENYFGFRYLYQQYKSKEGVYNNSPYAKDVFQTVQLWGKIPLSNRWALLPSIPFQYHQSQKTSYTQSIKGLGDISVNAIYKIIDNQQNDFEHTLYAGVGIKLPTGRYDLKNNGSVNPGFQLGTGSWDVSFLAEYGMKYKKWGLHQSAAYQLKNTNKKHYKFGNQFNYQATLYRAFGDTLQVFPNLGVAYEKYEKNEQYDEVLNQTGGHIFLSKIAINGRYKKWGMGAAYYIPIAQKIQDNRVIAKSRCSFYLNYSL